MKIQYIQNAGEFSGVGQRASQIGQRLAGMSEVELVDWMVDGEKGELRMDGRVQREIQPWPGALGSKSINWMRLGRKISGDGEGVWHLTNQSLSFLAGRLTPSVVTVHDVIEVTDPQDSRAAWLNAYLYAGIRRADHVVAVSEYTKQAVKDVYGVSDDMISVIYNGIDVNVFHPLGGVERDLDLMLYVGSEHPRKNFVTVLEVLAKVRESRPNMRLIKVGGAGLAAGRVASERAMMRLGLGDVVEWRESVSTIELNELYSRAGVLLFPSLHEGFGLPPLEALAAGCPVVCSNATSLPEVVGEAALTHDPEDVDAMTEAALKVLGDESLRLALREKGFEQAGKFSWDVAAEKVLGVYKDLV